MKLLRYEHGNVVFRAFGVSQAAMGQFADPWDAGVEGYVLVKEGSKTEDECIDAANKFLEFLSEFCNGHIYGYVITDQSGDEVDSCWNIIGMDAAQTAAMGEADRLSKLLPKQGELEL